METKVITGKCRLSYVNIAKPKKMSEDSEPKYSVSLIIPKTDKETLAKVKKAIQAALDEGVTSKFGGKKPATWKNPLRDGDEERPEDEAYQGAYFLNANSARKPGVVDRNRDEILDIEEELYSGCYGRASVNFYAFNVNGNRGVACGLNNIQKLADGERLGGGAVSAQDDFGDDLEDDLF